MTWKVAIRDKDGRRIYKNFEAASRQDLFATLNAEGITALCVEELNSESGRYRSKIAITNSKIARCSLLVFVGFAILLCGYFLFSGDRAREISENRTITPKKCVAQLESKDPIDPRDSGTNVVKEQQTDRTALETYRDEKGILRYKGGLRVLDPNRKKTDPVKIGFTSKSGTSIFKNRAEHEIARLLTMRPGQSMIGTRRYDKRFEDDYAKSLTAPIIISKDDTPQEAALKKAMIEAKIEISDRLRQGEKLGDILEQTRSELVRLSKVKRDVEKLIRDETRNPEMTEEEISDYIAAANKLLEKEGIAPINGNAIIRNNLLLKMKGK